MCLLLLAQQKSGRYRGISPGGPDCYRRADKRLGMSEQFNENSKNEKIVRSLCIEASTE